MSKKDKLAEQPASVIQLQLAGLLYFDHETDAGHKNPAAFDKLAEDDRNLWLTRARKCLIALDKMNLSPQPVKETKASADEYRKSVEVLTGIIKGFVNELRTVKNKDLFPCEELAHRILK